MKRASVVLLAVLMCVSFASALDQPNMTAARNDLNKAESSLRQATGDKGGHRNRAIELIGQAVAEINRGIEYDRATPGNGIRRPGRRRQSDDLNESNFVATSDQPKMQTARDQLQDALNHLQRATADKGGHRARAIELVRDAIAEVNKGIAFDRSN